MNSLYSKVIVKIRELWSLIAIGHTVKLWRKNVSI